VKEDVIRLIQRAPFQFDGNNRMVNLPPMNQRITLNSNLGIE